MKSQRITGFLMFIFIAVQVMAAAQVERASPSGGEVTKGVKAASARASTRRDFHPVKVNSQPVSVHEETSVPVRHLFGDLDNDGLKDLFVLDHEKNLLFHNTGKSGFNDVTASSFPAGAGQGGRGILGDYNGDGLRDLFLFHRKGITLYRNDGELRFSDVTQTLGLPSGLGNAQVSLEDIDGDGFEDLLLGTPDGDRIFRNREGRAFTETILTGPRGGRSASLGKVPPVQSQGGAAGPGLGSSGTMNASTLFVNDNSPGSVGLGVPEVEGGDDTTTLNDIVDGTVTGEDILDGSVTGADIENSSITSSDIKNGTVTGTDISNESITGTDVQDESITGTDIQDSTLTGADIQNLSLTGSDIAESSIDPGKIDGTAATLKGSQTFDKGTLHIDATNHRVGIGTNTPSSSSLHIDSDETYGCRVETSKTSGWAVYGRASATAGIADGVYGESESTSGKGLYGRARAATGTTYGVRGESESTSGRGVYGLASTSTGTNYGVKGHSSSTSGRGVTGTSPYMGIEGASTGTSGSAYGVYGETASTSGRGIAGLASASTGVAYGVKGDSQSTTGRGVGGLAGASSGTTYGVYGQSNSTSGRGVYGNSTASSGTTYGVRGASASTSGRGVYGSVTASSGVNYGVKGYSSSTSGYGVYGSSSKHGVHGSAEATTGFATGVGGSTGAEWGTGVDAYASHTTGINYGMFAVSNSSSGFGLISQSHNVGINGSTYTGATGTGWGVWGQSNSTGGRGVYGYHPSSTGTNYGVFGWCSSTSGRAVYGLADAVTGTNYGVRGYTSSGSGYGVYSSGDLGCSGTKSFVQPHPEDPSKEIRFVCLEGNESGTYFRGSASLEAGMAVIDVPEAFRLVTEPEGLTVQVTPRDLVRICVEEKSLDRIVVRGDLDVEFDYFVNGVRRGFKEFEPIRANTAWVPEFKDEPYGTQYPEALRKILVENGTLNPDFTPNKKTAAMMGWTLQDELVAEVSTGDTKNRPRPDQMMKREMNPEDFKRDSDPMTPQSSLHLESKTPDPERGTRVEPEKGVEKKVNEKARKKGANRDGSREGKK